SLLSSFSSWSRSSALLQLSRFPIFWLHAVPLTKVRLSHPCARFSVPRPPIRQRPATALSQPTWQVSMASAWLTQSSTPERRAVTPSRSSNRPAPAPRRYSEPSASRRPPAVFHRPVPVALV